MSVVGPSGSGKTRLIFSMLNGQTFYPKFDKIYYFYKEYQDIFTQMTAQLNIEFVPCVDFEMIKSLSNCLLVFDDSCEEIYQEKDFVKIAVSGRHRKLSCIFIKHNLFHQSKWSRTIDLNTTHVVIFKNPRDTQQIDYFGRQLNKTDFLRDCYQKATVEAFGHLLIDFAPKTTDGLRFCSNITGPLPTIFYLPTSQARVTPITNEEENVAYTRAMA